MDDLISREEAIRELEEQLTYNDADEGVIIHGTLFWNSDLVKNIIRYDVRSHPRAERKNGKWIGREIDTDFAKCSECGSCWGWGLVRNCNMDFCPNCGADMRGDNNET